MAAREPRGGRVRLVGPLLAFLAAGCGSPCEEAAQICADEGRSSAVSPSMQQATCEGSVEAHAICIVESESCAPDVVEACLADSGAEVEGS